MYFQNLKTMLLKMKKRNKLVLVVLISSTLLFVTLLLVIVFGIDQKILITPLNGKLLSEKGEPIESAEVILQGQTVRSNEKGEFFFEDVNFGTFDIIVTKNGFVKYDDKIKIKRFSNNALIVLKTQEYGEMNIVFDTDNPDDRNINIKINNQAFQATPTERGFEVQTGRLLVGKYLLEFSSIDYRDFQERIQLEPGSSEKIIKIYPSGDLLTEFVDFATDESLVPEEVLLEENGTKVDMNVIEITNKLEIKNLEIDKSYKLTVKKDGFINREISFIPKQGLNSLDKTYLYQDMRVLITDGKEVKSIRLDGSRGEVLFRADRGCSITGIKLSYYSVVCGSTLAVFEKKDGNFKLVREFYINEGEHDLNVKELKLFILSLDGREIQQLHSTINRTSVYTHSNRINTIISDHSGNIYFSDNDAVYRLRRNENEAAEIIKGRYYLEDISPDGISLIALGNIESAENNIWLINLSSNQSNRISFLPGNYSNIKFNNNSEFYFKEGTDLYLSKINSTDKTKVAQDISSFWNDPAQQLLWATRKNELVIISKINNSIKPFAIN